MSNRNNGAPMGSSAALARLALTARLGFSILLLLSACEKNTPSEPVAPEDGYMAVDSKWVVDAYDYDSVACSEVLSSGVGSAESIAKSSVAVFTVTSTACYKVEVQVEDSVGKRVRTFAQQFSISQRSVGDKNRGVVGYISWDGKNDSGQNVVLARYLWRLHFDFGKGRNRRIRADIRLD